MNKYSVKMDVFFRDGGVNIGMVFGVDADDEAMAQVVAGAALVRWTIYNGIDKFRIEKVYKPVLREAQND